jgi:hypothetical protein
MQIVSVQFSDKFNPDRFYGREYHYFSEDNLIIGDIVIAPTQYGESLSVARRIDVEEREIEEFKGAMKTIPNGSKVM